jgi:hypothetical protein
MMTPFQGCGSETRSINGFYCTIIFKNPERVIAFRIGHRPIKWVNYFLQIPNLSHKKYQSFLK